MDEVYFEQMSKLCDEAWQNIADSFWEDLPNAIISLFTSFLDNPVCLVIIYSLVGMAAFYLLLRLIRILLRR